MRPEFSSPPSSVCVLRLSAIGDTCHTVPAVRALQSAWPDTRITWIVGRTEYGLLEGLGGVEFIVFDKRAGLAGYAAVRRQLGRHRFALLLHMHASMRANAVSLLVRADQRLGFDRARARDYQWLFTNRTIPAVPQQHVMDGLLEFVRTLGIPAGPPRWDIPIPDDAAAFADRVIDRSRPALVISPCTGQRLRNYRNWDARRYAEVADYARQRHGAQILLTGGNTAVESRYAAEITAQSSSRPVNLVGATTLKQLLAILARTSVLLCPDSGPAHMATAVGTPVVGLYATSNPARTGPYLSLDLVADRYEEAVRGEFDTEPGALKFGKRVRDPEAMNLITVDDVITRLDMAFARSSMR